MIALGQTEQEILNKYKGKTRNRSNGITIKSKSKLILYSDSTYFYRSERSDGECGLSFIENGIFKISGDTLTLYQEFRYKETNEIGYMEEGTTYVMRDKKLYYPNSSSNETLALK